MIKRSLNFFLDKEKDRSDFKLRFRVKWGAGLIAAFGVGFRVESSKWSTETQRCKNGTTHGKNKIPASVINSEITNYFSSAEALFAKYERDCVVPSLDEFRSAFNFAVGKACDPTPVVSLFDAFDEFIKTESGLNCWSHSMVQKFGTFKNHLSAFNPSLSFEMLTDSVMTDFVNYQHRLDLYNTSIDKNLRYFRWFLRWAVRHGYYSGSIHETFRPRLKGTDGSNREVIHLTWDELMSLCDFDFMSAVRVREDGTAVPVDEFQKAALDRVRDVFCFCCFTGLRYSDVAKLGRADVRDDCIFLVTQKTADSLKIELNNHSRAILEKYAGVHFAGGLALPVISNQKMNDQLKVACELVGIDAPQRVVFYKGNKRHEVVSPKYAVISTHAGRRTFIVNALFLGIPSEVIMRWTGHKNFASMKPYVKIVDDLKLQEMKKFDR